MEDQETDKPLSIISEGTEGSDNSDSSSNSATKLASRPRKGSKKNRQKKRVEQSVNQLSPKLAYLLEKIRQVNKLDECIFRMTKLLHYIQQFSYFDEEDEQCIQNNIVNAKRFIDQILSQVGDQDELGDNAQEYINLQRAFTRRQHALQEAEMDGMLGEGDPTTAQLSQKQMDLNQLLTEGLATFA